jgi:hypothetical protein
MLYFYVIFVFFSPLLLAKWQKHGYMLLCHHGFAMTDINILFFIWVMLTGAPGILVKDTKSSKF